MGVSLSKRSGAAMYVYGWCPKIRLEYGIGAVSLMLQNLEPCIEK